MPFVYVYSPSDFVATPPDEAGSDADGSGPFTLTLSATATPTLIEVTDDDAIFDEIDGSQVLTNAVNLDGTNYAANTTIHTAYDLINSVSGHRVTSIHFGGDGYQQGAIDGIISTVPLTAGTSYTFDTDRTSHQKDNDYNDYFACFTSNSSIQTEHGPIRARDLVPGDKIQTMDNGLQTLRMVLRRALGAEDLKKNPNMRPVCIKAGALGSGLPTKDLLVSPQHRLLVQSHIAERMFGEAEVLASAKKMTKLPGIFVVEDCSEVEYFHLILDRHEIVFADGAPTESFFFGPVALDVMSSETREELVTLFPKLLLPGFTPSQARIIPSHKQQAKLVQRHKKNSKAIFERL